MKSRCLLLALALSACSSAQAAAVFWSFQNNADGTGGAKSTLTSNDGFAGTPAVTQFVNAGTNTPNAQIGAGGTSSYSYGGTTWLGSGSGSSPGYSMLWGTSSGTGSTNGTSALAGIGFTVGLNTTGLTDLSVAFQVRSATGDSAVATPPAGFSAIEYSIAGGAWTATGLESGITWPAASGTGFSSRSINFSSIDAIENQSDVQIRFTFTNGSVPTANVTQNIRIDNLLINAVPEPASISLAGLGLAGLILRRRR